MDNVGANTGYPTEMTSMDGGSAGFLQPYKLQSGVMRGTQVILGMDGSKILLGDIPNGNDFGLAYYDPSGNLISEQTGTLYTVYDADKKKAVQLGRQLDGSVNLKFFDSIGIGLAQFGRFLDGSTALKVAKANIEVSTAPDDQLIFNSSQDIFKIVKTDTATLSIDNAVNFSSLTIPHNLGYAPAHEVYITGLVSATSRNVLPYTALTFIGTPGSQTTFINFHMYAYVDDTNLYIQYEQPRTGGSGIQTYQLLYYLRQETAG